MRRWLLFLPLLALGCAAARAAGERGTQVAAGGALAAVLYLLMPIPGILGAAVCGIGGALASLFFAPRPGAPEGTASQFGPSPLGWALIGLAAGLVFLPGFRRWLFAKLKSLLGSAVRRARGQ